MDKPTLDAYTMMCWLEEWTANVRRRVAFCRELDRRADLSDADKYAALRRFLDEQPGTYAATGRVIKAHCEAPDWQAQLIDASHGRQLRAVLNRYFGERPALRDAHGARLTSAAVCPVPAAYVPYRVSYAVPERCGPVVVSTAVAAGLVVRIVESAPLTTQSAQPLRLAA